MRAHTSSAVPHLAKQNTYESRRGSTVVLEFADPTSSPQKSPLPTPTTVGMPRHHSAGPPPTLSRGKSWQGAPSSQNGWLSPDSAATTTPPSQGHGQTRLQMTVEALKRMGAGMASPRADHSPRKTASVNGNGEVRMPGYFDVVSETNEE